MKKNFDCVTLMRDIREQLSNRYAGNPELMMRELREARERFEARCAAIEHAVAEPTAPYGKPAQELSKRAKFSKPLARRFAANPAPRPTGRALLADVRRLILQARAGVARAVDSSLVTLYWHVGRRIRQDILKEKRGVWTEDCVRTGDAIERGVWARLRGAKSLSHAPVRGGLPG